MDPMSLKNTTLPTDIQQVASTTASVAALPGFTPNKKNALLPILRLQEEVLVIIFQYAVESDGEGRRNIRDVQNVMNVCQRWYGIVLGFPAFWTNIDLASASLANEMVQRAQSLPIYITHDLVRVDCRDRLDSRLFDMSRIGGLKFSSYRRAFYPSTQKWCNDYVYRVLDMFEGISTLRSFHFSRSSQDEDPLVVPIRLFPPSPRLQHLQLDGCRVSWKSLDPKCLSELLSLDLDDISCPETVEQLCSVLSKTQKLQKLTLSCHYLHDGAPLHLCSAPSEPRPPRCSLPRLAFIRIKATTCICVSILTHISFPANSTVDFETRGFIDKTSKSSLLPFLLSHESILKSSHFCDHRNLLIDHKGELDYGVLELWDGPVDIFRDCSVAPSNPPTRIHYHQAPTQRVLAALTVPHLQLLDLADFPCESSDDGCSAADWRSFLDRHPEIIHFRVTTGSFTRIAAILSSAENEGTPLPQLRTLFINAHWDIAFCDDTDVAKDIQALLVCLTDRHQHGQSLETLAINRAFKVGEEELTLLKEVVQNVMEI